MAHADTIYLYCTLEELAFCRLACLARMQGKAAIGDMWDAWESLRLADKELLADAFVADGIKEKAYIYMFLPLCFALAQKNKAVGVRNMLLVLVELIDHVRWYSCPDLQTASIVVVDVSDLASFIGGVRSPSVLLTCLERSKFRQSCNKMQLVMTEQNWRLVHDYEGLQPSTYCMLRHLTRSQEGPEEIFERRRPGSRASACNAESPELEGEVYF